jgi:L-rhamnose mutarotase
MIRRAFTMKLKPGASDEYVRHHDSIPEKWSQLVDEIRDSGIAQITTFQNGLDLFLYSEISDEGAWDKLWHSEIHRKWAELMEPLMHLDENGIVQAGELTEIFHLETSAK